MPRDDSWHDEDDDFSEDDSYCEDESTDTVPCPHCGAEVYEDAPQCPSCGTYIPADTSTFSGRPTWWIILGVLGVLAVILALTFSSW